MIAPHGDGRVEGSIAWRSAAGAGSAAHSGRSVLELKTVVHTLAGKDRRKAWGELARPSLWGGSESSANISGAPAQVVGSLCDAAAGGPQTKDALRSPRGDDLWCGKAGARSGARARLTRTVHRAGKQGRQGAVMPHVRRAFALPSNRRPHPAHGGRGLRIGGDNRPSSTCREQIPQGSPQPGKTKLRPVYGDAETHSRAGESVERVSRARRCPASTHCGRKPR